MTKIQLILIATFGSIALLAGAYLFQALGYAPCKMCYWQRYPHALAIILGAICLLRPHGVLLICGAASAATTGAVGLFHSGVEQKWWDGPSSCTGGNGLSGLSGNDLLATNVVDKVVMCDEISWAFAGLSMPTWNAILSLGLVVIWFAAWRKAA